MKIELDIRLQQKDVFGFNMYHNYHRAQTWFFTLLGVVIFALGLTTFDEVDIMYSLLYLLCGLIFVFYTPINLRTSAKLAMRAGNPLAERLHYVFTETGVAVSYAEKSENENASEDEGATESRQVDWKQLYRVVETKKHILLYTTRVNASILPKEQIGEKLTPLKELMGEYVPAYRLKVKKQ